MKNVISTFALFVVLMLSGAVDQTAVAQNSAEQKPSITIVEYSDYQCPACGYFHPIIKKIKEKYGDQVQLELKFFPLNSHRYAALAARAAQAAKNQGKFREMHNMLYEHQKQWSESGNPAPKFVNYAREIGLDIEQFKNELNARETQQAVMQQKKEGQQQGVRATPTFIIEGDQIGSLPKNFNEFDQLVQQYLNEKKAN
ncbi:MAG: thioredoxin domain-containing protein [Fodinibius sp.]|nr:thioredoxin domain-containing protein [Fodinibius sp.]